MKFAVVVFPGTSGETDLHHAIVDMLNEEAEYVSHKEENLDQYDAILLPGGYSYGNYLRPGALASKTPVVNAIKKAAAEGKPVLGISDGFQVLLEAGLLPGVMMKNEQLKFICRQVDVIVENNETLFTTEFDQGEKVLLPIAHSDGNYYCDDETLATLKANKQIVFRYNENVNGAKEQIAGLMNEQGNVLGMMPYPERAVEALLGSEDGLKLFKSMLRNWRETHVVTQ
ncbi:MAG TPA: phosphoribosylformylglycinamidine synthase subunit PurQ [Bacilli bacterium]|nr:phosphoribosylformylglycinamidine synthase subunit PurQ [Bacilli bacterium]